ncbi:hypothetical protein C8J57DRAFT_1396370 [Mycena rebaudengoi]|nr:hypothetical protein C8J57DRAFT_1396370 [Mycena rebaudengoi]
MGLSRLLTTAFFNSHSAHTALFRSPATLRPRFPALIFLCCVTRPVSYARLTHCCLSRRVSSCRGVLIANFRLSSAPPAHPRPESTSSDDPFSNPQSPFADDAAVMSPSSEPPLLTPYMDKLGRVHIAPCPAGRDVPTSSLCGATFVARHRVAVSGHRRPRLRVPPSSRR